ncbi:fibronectin type III domain-containing protein, partial [Microbulbifer sp. 2304DJ12-6]|uniref:fibronectin type III domain-containing protein n=1 Tax=Microbulbifer sp. 2304DJ12-6 TaxID=3233340 RepID=UPI0039AEE6AA
MKTEIKYACKSVTVTSTPANLSYPSADLDGAFTVSWSASSGANRYELYRRFNSGPWGRIYNSSGTSVNERGLSAGSYQYRVRACTPNMCSGYKMGGPIIVGPPPRPASISVPDYVSSSSANLSWAASSGATRYELQQRKDGGSWSSNIYSGSATSTRVDNLEHGSVYRFRVRACATFCSSYREGGNLEVYFRPGVPSPGVSPGNSLDGKYTVSWNSKPFATRYQLVNEGGTVEYNGAGLSKDFTGIGNGTYRYKV